MDPTRVLMVSFALTLANPIASATDMVVNQSAQESSEIPAPPTTPKKVRIIDMSSANTDKSDQTKWYNRVPKPPVQKNAVKVETAHAETPAEKPKKKRAVQRAAPKQDAYSAYASETTREPRGFGFFNWQ